MAPGFNGAWQDGQGISVAVSFCHPHSPQVTQPFLPWEWAIEQDMGIPSGVASRYSGLGQAPAALAELDHYRAFRPAVRLLRPPSVSGFPGWAAAREAA